MRCFYFILILIVLSLFHVSCNKTKDMKKDLSIYKNGDIVFRLGDSSVSNAVLVADENSPYSHIGIIYKYNDNPVVIHACPPEINSFNSDNYIKMDSISSFFSTKNAISGALYRYPDEMTANEAAEEAYRLYALNVPFDYLFDSSDSSELYCSELVEYVYMTLGVSLTNNKRHKVHIPCVDIDSCIFISDFLIADKLKIVDSF